MLDECWLNVRPASQDDGLTLKQQYSTYRLYWERVHNMQILEIFQANNKMIIVYCWYSVSVAYT